MAGSLGRGLFGGLILLFSWSEWEKSWLTSIICGVLSDCNQAPTKVKLGQTCLAAVLEKLDIFHRHVWNLIIRILIQRIMWGWDVSSTRGPYMSVSKNGELVMWARNVRVRNVVKHIIYPQCLNTPLCIKHCNNHHILGFIVQLDIICFDVFIYLHSTCFGKHISHLQECHCILDLRF
jgi:hypothetical protein